MFKFEEKYFLNSGKFDFLGIYGVKPLWIIGKKENKILLNIIGAFR